MPPTDDNVSLNAVRLSQRLPQRAGRHYIRPPILLCRLSDDEGFHRTASGKEVGRNTETEVTTTAWHEGLQKLRQFLFSCSQDEEEDMKIITDDAMRVQFCL